MRYWLIAMVVMLASCVQIKMPENMVSDTVQAGKDAYHAVVDSDEPKQGVDGVYIFTYQGTDKQTIAELKAGCIAGLEEVMKAELKQDAPKYELIDQHADTAGEQPSMVCKAKVVQG